MTKMYINCLALKRKIQREISLETKGMAPLQRLMYYQKLVDESPFFPLLRKRSIRKPSKNVR